MKLDYYAQRALPLSYVVLIGFLYSFAPSGETGEHAEDQLFWMTVVGAKGWLERREPRVPCDCS